MLEKDQHFKHQSLQDKESIQSMLKSICKAMSKGELTFSDQNGEIILEPTGLLDLKIKASKQDSLQQLDLTISWKTEDKQSTASYLNIK
jgi:amphi-Trp domain-containing protein